MFEKTMVIISILFLILIIGIQYGSDDYYRCVDYFGNIVYCDIILKERGEVYGVQEDGTTIKITSYKMVDRSEVEKDEK